MEPLIDRLREAAQYADVEFSPEDAGLMREAADTIERMSAALAPFAECCEQIADAEDDEEWAKFRLLVKNYRLARDVLANV